MIYKLESNRTALLVIDVQKEYFKEDGPAYIPYARSVLPNIERLINAARKSGVLVVYMQHLNRADGTDIGRMSDFSGDSDEKSFVEGSEEVELINEINALDGEVIIHKRRYSCFLNTDLECVLRTRDINTVIISGYMTSFCCETTARDAHGRDYRVLFVSDANEGPDLATSDEETVSHDTVLRSTIIALRNGFAEIVLTSEVEDRLLKK